MVVNHGILYAKNFVVQTHVFSVKMAPKLLNFGAKIEPLAGYYDQNKARACIQFSATLFQSLNKLISKVYRTWEANSTCHCDPMAPVSVPPMPKFGTK